MRSALGRAAVASAFLLPVLLPGAQPGAPLPSIGRLALADASALAVAVTPAVVPVTGGSVLVTGDGFGASAVAFGKLGWSAKIDDKTAKLTWVSATSLRLAVPAGKAGTSPSIVLSRGADSTEPDTTSVRYGAGISKAVASIGPSGPVLKLTGAGFTGSDGWQLTPEAEGGLGFELLVGTDPATVGVVLESDTAATVIMPPAPGPAGAYRLSFVPAAGVPFAPSDAGRYVYKLPTVSGLSVPALSTDGGSFAVKGTGLLAVPAEDPAALTLTSVADPSVSVGLTVTERADTLLKVTAAAAPAGDYTLAVATPLGPTVVKGKVTLALVAPLVVSVPEGATVPATGGPLLVDGAGFGASKQAFTTAKIAATANGKKAAVTWVSDTRLAVAVPAGDPGTQAAVVLTRRDVPSTPLQVTYLAAIAKLSASTGPSTGGTVVTVTGRGFAGASSWMLADDSGGPLVALPTLASLEGTEPGVVIVDDGKATVRMPATDRPFRVVVLTVVPDQERYPGAAYLPTSKAVFVYTDAG